jgi:DNA-binding LytR/AlgR family response regulator
MNIAICDDDIYTIGKLEMIVTKTMKEMQTPYSLDSYSSGEEIYNTIKKLGISYQIILLDIKMGYISGFKIAALIRELSNKVLIIFVTCYKELMAEAFEVNAFHYIVKPFSEEKVRRVIEKAVTYLGMKKDIFQFKISRSLHSLFIDQIIYFECQNRKIFVCTDDQHIYEYYGVLKEVKEKINAAIFVQVNPSFIINMNYISTLSNKLITLHTGETLAITSKYYDNFNHTYRRYIMMRVRL